MTTHKLLKKPEFILKEPIFLSTHKTSMPIHFDIVKMSEKAICLGW